jgi:hypothetical protein
MELNLSDAAWILEKTPDILALTLRNLPEESRTITHIFKFCLKGGRRHNAEMEPVVSVSIANGHAQIMGEWIVGFTTEESKSLLRASVSQVGS